MEKRPDEEPKRGQERELSKAQPRGVDVRKGAPDSGPVPGTAAGSVQTTLPVKAASQGLEVVVPTRVDPLLFGGALDESARREQVTLVSTFMLCNRCIVTVLWIYFESLFLDVILSCAGGTASATAPETAWSGAREERTAASTARSLLSAE
jgi:hypothetical protein